MLLSFNCGKIRNLTSTLFSRSYYGWQITCANILDFNEIPKREKKLSLISFSFLGNFEICKQKDKKSQYKITFLSECVKLLYFLNAIQRQAANIQRDASLNYFTIFSD